MKHLLTFVALVTLLAIASCCRKSNEPGQINYTPPSAFDYSWFVAVPDGDRIYKNQFGEFDTLIANFPDTVYNSSLPPGGSYKSCETVELRGYLRGSFRRKSDSVRIATLNSVSHELLHTDKILLQIGLAPGLSVEELLPDNDTVMTINGVPFGDVSAFTDIKKSNGTVGEFFTKLYWSQAKGIVKYETPDGDVWELIN